jgi:hypothetical protein
MRVEDFTPTTVGELRKFLSAFPDDKPLIFYSDGITDFAMFHDFAEDSHNLEAPLAIMDPYEP